jgi:hypothetical protein
VDCGDGLTAKLSNTWTLVTPPPGSMPARIPEPGEHPVRWCVLSNMTDEPLSEFEHGIDHRARGLLVAVLIALIGLVALTILLAAGPSPIP